MRENVQLQPAPKVILRSRWFNEQQAESSSQKTSSIQQMQPCATGSSRRPVHSSNETRSQDENPEQSDLVDTTTSVCNNIDLRIDGILETAILHDEKADERYNKGDSEAGGEQSRPRRELKSRGLHLSRGNGQKDSRPSHGGIHGLNNNHGANGKNNPGKNKIGGH